MGGTLRQRGTRRAAVAAVALVGVLGAAAPARAAEQQAFAGALTYLTPAVVAAQGDTLRFTNLDLLRHDLVSDEAGLFASPLIGNGESALVAGVENVPPGRYGFHCTLHPWMVGALTVTEAGVPAPPEPPTPEPPGGGDGPDPVSLLPKVPPAPSFSGAWPSYGHDLSNSRDGGQDGPSPAQAATLGPVWSMRSADGDFTGTPVVADGTLVAGSGGGTVYALDARTGALRWSHDFDKTINASAAIADGRVYVPLVVPGSPSLAALDLASGDVLWERPLVDPAEPQMATADTYGSPRVWDGKVFMGTSGYFGEQVSEAEVQARGSVVALDAGTGDLLWRTYTVPPGRDGGAVWSTPAVDPDTRRLYVGTGNAYHEPAADTTDSILALDADSGDVVDHFQATAGDAWNGAEDSLENPDADFGASPNLFTGPDGRKLVGAGQKSGVYWALDRAGLDPVWSAVTGPGSFVGGTVGSTAVDAKGIYGPNTHAGLVWSLGHGGALRWASSDAAPLRWNAVSVANGVVYASDPAGLLTARDATTGAVLAKLPLGAPSWGGVSIAGGHVFAVTGIGSDAGYVVAFRPRAE